MSFDEMTITLDNVCHVFHVLVVEYCIYKADGGKYIQLDSVVKLLVGLSLEEMKLERSLMVITVKLE